MKKQSRRKFIINPMVSAAAATGLNKVLWAMETKEKKQLIHHVFFWLKNRNSQEDLQKLLAGLQTLRKIETVRAIHIGVPAATESRPVIDATYSVSELILFDDLPGQKIYQEHPVHQRFVAEYSHLWERVVVYDSMDV